MHTRIFAAVLFALALVSPGPVSRALAAPAKAAPAQKTVPAPKPVLRGQGEYANLFHFRFKPGKSDEALHILKTTLIPAYARTGVKVTLIEDLLGTKDAWLLVPLKKGPDYYRYEIPKQDADAWAALAAEAGGSDKAEKAMDDFIGYVERQSQTMVFVPK